MGGIFESFTQETAYLVVASASTLLFLLKLALTLLGGDHDIDDLSHPDGTASFTLFSTQSVLAFLMGAGWMGLAGLRELGFGGFVALAVAGAFGLAMMVLAAAVAYGMQRLNHEPVAQLASCVGTRGQVYLAIPARGEGTGKVEVTVSGARRIVKAMSTDAAIGSFTAITVVSVKDHDTVLVKPA